MSSKDIVIHVENVSKCFAMYNAPADRLKQMVYPRLLKGIKKDQKAYYNAFWALQNVSFDVQRGQTVGIIGQNGSGKSTLLQIITGTLSPTGGSVSVKGRIAALLELGSGFNPEFSGMENVYLNAALLGLSRNETDKKMDEILSFADIGPHIEQPVKTYSSGMMLRLAFAVQVAVETEVVIIDEALAVGDARFQLKCMKRLDQLKNNGTTILFVSHSAETIRSLCEYGLVLERGKTIFWGDAKKAATKYYELLFPKDQSLEHLTEDSHQFLDSDTREETLSEDNLDSQMVSEDDLNLIQREFFCQKSDWGHGGAVIKSVQLKNIQEPNILSQGVPFLAELEVELDLKKINNFIGVNCLQNTLFFGIRLDTHKGITLVDHFTSMELSQEIAEGASKKKMRFTLDCKMPILQQGEYFLTPGIAVGSLNAMEPLCSYDNVVSIQITGEHKVHGLFYPQYTFKEIA